ncbi:MAG: phage tail sheath C-terminal domain-containing protein [Bacteroidota bacterium]
MLNLNTLATPGVYIDEVSLLPPSVAAVATAIPAFIGYTKKGEQNVAKRITSFAEFQEIFGGAYPDIPEVTVTITDTGVDKFDDSTPPEHESFTSNNRTINAVDSLTPVHNLYYAMRLFYDNGGGDCYVVSAGAYGGTISASDLEASVVVLKEEDEPTIIVVPEAASLDIVGINTVFMAATTQAADLKDRFVLIDVPQAEGKVQEDVIDTFQKDISIGDHPQFAAAYYPMLETTIDLAIAGIEDKVKIVHELKTEDGAASKINEGDPNEGKGAFDGKSLAEIGNDLLVKQIENAVNNISLILPPSPAIAGIYTRVDNDRGVWKAPANVSIARVVAPTVKITDDTQGSMNIDPNGGKSVNAIRAFTGRGILVWGARTLNGNDNEWRYISVRRFFNFVEESVKKASYRFVFEPNDANTWNSMRAMIENFLTIQWNQGALQGAKADDAFFVRVGLGQTMTALDILEGRLIVEIGMAVVRPAEFIILRFMHKLPEA